MKTRIKKVKHKDGIYYKAQRKVLWFFWVDSFNTRWGKEWFGSYNIDAVKLFIKVQKLFSRD